VANQLSERGLESCQNWSKMFFNGLLYPPSNHQYLVEKIQYLVDLPKGSRQMGINGFKWVSKEFTIEI